MKKQVRFVLRHVVLLLLAVIWLVPIVWLVVTSFSGMVYHYPCDCNLYLYYFYDSGIDGGLYHELPAV